MRIQVVFGKVARFCLVAALLTAQSAAIPAQDLPPRAQLTQRTRILPGEQGFTPVIGVFVSPDGGRVAVSRQQQDGCVLVYNATGRFLFPVGCHGSGRGDFQLDVASAGWIADTLWTFEGNQRSISFIDPAGRVIRTTSLAGLTRGPSMRGLPAGTQGRFTPAVVLGGGTMFGSYAGRIVHASAQGEMRAVPFPSSLVPAPLVSADTQALEQTSVPFVVDPVWLLGAGPNRIVHVDAAIGSDAAATVSLEIFDGDGKVVRTGTLRVASLERIPKNAVDRAVEKKLKRYTNGRSAAENERSLRERIPKFYSPITDAGIGADSSVWVSLRTSAGLVHVVFDRDGSPQYSVILPERSRIVASHGAVLWVVELLDSTDGTNYRPSVVQYAVKRAK